MFRLEYLKLIGHPQLGDLELFLSESNELKSISKPYTSLIIGPNGTGKSYILKTIAEIFRQFQAYSLSGKKDLKLPFNIQLRYVLNNNTYEIITKKLQTIERAVGKRGSSSRRDYIFLKNKPLGIILNDNGNFLNEKITGFEINPSEVEYPKKLIVNSVMLTDRFIWKNSNPSDFYQYLGVRSTKTTSSTQSSSRRTIRYLLSTITTNKDFIQNLKDLLNFLEFEENFKVHYSTKINRLFFSGSLSIYNFKKYYEEWWDEEFVFSKRKQENPLWSIPYYNRNFKDDFEKTEQLVEFLNRISRNSNGLLHKRNSPSKILPIDLFDSNLNTHDLEMIGHLESLDIINLDGIKIIKSNSTLSINEGRFYNLNISISNKYVIFGY